MKTMGKYTTNHGLKRLAKCTVKSFKRSNLIAFMKGSSTTVAMADYNSAAKNMQSLLVLRSTIVTNKLEEI